MGISMQQLSRYLLKEGDVRKQVIGVCASFTKILNTAAASSTEHVIEIFYFP